MTPNHPLVNERSERNLLGQCLVTDDAFGRVGALVKAEDFWSERHRVLWRAIAKVGMAGETPEPIRVFAALEVNEQWRRYWPEFSALADVFNRLVMATPELLAREIGSLAALRRLVDLGRGIEAKAYRVGQDVEERERLASDLQRELLAALEPLVRTHDRGVGRETLAETMDRIVAALEAARDGVFTESPTVPLGFPSIDQHFEAPVGGMTVVGGYPGTGKSIFLKQVLERWAQRGLQPHLVNLEDENTHYGMRLLAAQFTNESKLDARHIRDLASKPELNGHKSNERRAALIARAQELRSLQLTWDQSTGLTAEQVRLQCREAVRRGARALALDIATRIEFTPNSGSGDREKLDHIIRQLGYIPQENRVPFLVAVHLRRRERNSGLPSMHDLRGSGNWENNARGILFTHQDEKFQREPIAEAMIRIVKASHDRPRDITFTLNKPHARWEEARPGAPF